MRGVSLVFVLSLIFSHVAHAGECTKDAQNSQKSGVNHLVVSFEGLASHFAGFVRKSLILNLQKRHPNEFVSKNYSYRSSSKAAACIRDWHQVFKGEFILSIVGHSFGGGIATFELLQKIGDIPVDHAVTLDPRSWVSDRDYRKNKDLFQFSNPGNVGYFVNFFQRGGMPGYKVRGAENFELKNTSHTRVPAHGAVFQAVDCALFEVCS